MKRNNDGEDFRQRLPGTGGDFIDEQDVEGHIRVRGDEDGLKRDDAEGYRMQVTGDDDDVEGHIRVRGDEELYRGGPSTQGEIVHRGPGDNPHGDR